MTSSTLIVVLLHPTVRQILLYSIAKLNSCVVRVEKYVQTIVNRYKHSSNIFAWELMNEARCRGDLQGGPNCVAGTDLISHWYKEQADFVREL